FHLIQVQERVGEQLRARHVLIPLERSEAEMDRLFARADSLEQLAGRSGIDRAARAVGATVRQGVVVTENGAFVPGVGSALEAFEWVRDDWQAEAEGQRPAVSELFETDQAFYVVRAEGFTPAGTVPLAEATPGIRRQLVLDKKRERAMDIGRAMAVDARRGKPLGTVAAERGLSVQTAGPFTRVDPNPVFGQANAAVGAAFGVPIGQVSDVVQSSAGLFLVRPVARTEANHTEWEAQKDAQRAIANAQLQQSVIGRWLQDLRRDAEIVDRRAQVLRRS
ncbi:MAG: hypothetical protein M3409_01850, partial [Gemmatimonadota bacterium]|nr:hypothetical protein [Gemmatimonadota bacterium]